MRLFYEFTILNSVLFVGLLSAWDLGILQIIYETDVSRITVIQSCLFVLVWLWEFVLARKIAISIAQPGSKWHPDTKKLLRSQHQFKTIQFLSQSLVALGLLGTVIGFAFAMQAIDPDSAGDVDKAGEMIGILGAGLGVAFYTTIVGAVLGLWIDFNRRLIEHRIEAFQWGNST